MKHKFAKPFTFEDVEYTELDLDLDSMTGQDLADIKRSWALAGNFSPVPAADLDFCAAAAAHAAKVPSELIYALPAKEFNKVTQAVMNFLNG